MNDKQSKHYYIVTEQMKDTKHSHNTHTLHTKRMFNIDINKLCDKIQQQ